LRVLSLTKEAIMCVRSSAQHVCARFGAALLSFLVVTTSGLRAEPQPRVSRSVPDGLATVKIVDALNLFSNVGALIYFVEPNDFGFPEGPISHCTGTLIHERAFLLAGHCTAPTGGLGGLLPFIKAFVSFSPNALDQSTWRTVSDLAWHPSLPPCPPPDLCTFRGLDPGILDIGLVFLEQPVRDIAPARLAKPGTLESAGALDHLMIVAGYGHLDSLPGGGLPPDSEWDGLRRIKISRLRTVVDNDWASWSLPGIVCFGDSGSPTFFRARVVAVASDGGFVCYERDDRARVDTTAAQDWIRQTIADVLGPQR
jgi:Trypsin